MININTNENVPSVVNLITEHNDLIDEYDALYKDYENVIAIGYELANTINQLKSDIKITTGELNQLKSELNVYTDSNRDASLVGQIKSLTIKLNESNKTVKQQTSQLKELKKVTAQLKKLQVKINDNKEAIDNYPKLKKELTVLKKYSDSYKEFNSRMIASVINSDKTKGYYPVMFSDDVKKEDAILYSVEVSPIVLFTQTISSFNNLKIIKIHDFEILVHGSDGVIYQVDLTEIGTFKIAIPEHLNVKPTGITYSTIREVTFKLTSMLTHIDSEVNTAFKNAINALFDVKIKGIIDDEFCKVLSAVKVDNLYQAICLLSNVSPDCFITDNSSGFDSKTVIKESLDKCIQYCKDNDNIIFIKPENKRLVNIRR